MKEETEMDRKILLAGVCALLGALLLTGCHSHTWAEATCAQPKTCTECGETEGETLEHTWQEASCAQPRTCTGCGETEGETLPHTLTEPDYQQAAVCTVCGAAVGEPLQADLEKYGLACVEGWDTPYPYTTQCSLDHTVTTTGTVTFSGHRVFTSDDTHEALDGYEWHVFTITYVYNDENAVRYGAHSSCVPTDYYDVAGAVASDGAVVHFYGLEYTKCSSDIEYVQSGWAGDDLICQFQCTAHCPAGYDGLVIAAIDGEISNNWESETTLIYDVANENTVFFRVK